MAPTAVGAEEEAALAKALEEAERANQEVRRERMLARPRRGERMLSGREY